MIVYTNGCSYAAFSNGVRYSEFLGRHYKCDSINAAIGGSCNNRILRSSLRDLIELKKQHQEIVATISLSCIQRTEIWHPNSSERYKWENSNDGDFASYQFAQTKNWYQTKNIAESIDLELREYGKNWLTWYNVEAETTNLLQQLILFSSWCKHENIKCVIFSGPLQESVDFSAPFIKPFYDTVLADPMIIDIFSQSFTEWCNNQGFTPTDSYTMEIHNKIYDCGHHGEQAHKAWANYLIEKYLP